MKIRDRDIIHHRKDQDCLYFKADGAAFCLSPWNADFRCYCWIDQKWMPVDRFPGLRLIFTPPRFRKPCSLRQRFLDRIPEEIRELARPFRWHQLSILRLMRFTPYAIDLAHSNPILLWLIAELVSTGNMTFKECRELIQLKQKQIVKRLYPYNPSLSVTFIKRFLMVDYDFNEFLALKKVTGDTAITLHLLHCGTINLKSLACSEMNEELLSCAFFKKLIREQETFNPLYKRIREEFYECLRIAEFMEKRNPWQVLKRCSDYKQLLRLHVKWANEVTDEQKLAEFMKRKKTPDLAPPKAPGTDTIVPITTVHELFEEGEELSHCVFSYLNEASSGALSFYKVLWPERGTIALSRGYNNFVVQEFKLHQNREPGELSWDMVSAWLKEINSPPD